MPRPKGSSNLPKHLKKWNDKYLSHKNTSIARGIDFNLTLQEWYNWWKDTGKIEQRGRYKGQYVMARYGDTGPYELGNIKCVTSEDNHLEHLVGKKHTEQTKKKMSEARHKWHERQV